MAHTTVVAVTGVTEAHARNACTCTRMSCTPVYTHAPTLMQPAQVGLDVCRPNPESSGFFDVMVLSASRGRWGCTKNHPPKEIFLGCVTLS